MRSLLSFSLLALLSLFLVVMKGSFTRAQAGVDQMLAIDNSASMLDEFPVVRAATMTYASTVGSGERIGAVSFEVEAILESPLTSDAALVRDVLSRLRCRNGGTRMDKGILLAQEEITLHSFQRPLMVVISDGYPDPFQRDSTREAAATSRWAGTEIYTVGIQHSGHSGTEGLEFMKSLASCRGENGHFFAVIPSTLGTLEEVMVGIHDRILACGNEVQDFEETCDDGVENSPANRCFGCCQTFCGDGIIQSPNGLGLGGPANDGREQCDDGNEISSDGCADCAVPVILSVVWDWIVAEQISAGVRVSWVTLEELGAAGFVVERAELENSPFSRISPPIAAVGPGYEYMWLDAAPVTGGWYRIRELCLGELSGCNLSPSVTWRQFSGAAGHFRHRRKVSR